MLEGVDFGRVSAVAELGPGSGAFTAPILERLRPGSVFMPIELNPVMASAFRARFPGVELHERSAADIGEICRAKGLPERHGVDVIFSGLPWAAFTPELQESLLDAVIGVLKPGGPLITFTYNTSLLTRAGRRFADVIARRFERVERSPTVLLNLPPAFVYRCYTAR
ncbi:MAG: methyltransferase domain-containing protein [Phycisphaeraceae bacterium]|nr:methyltransferase domain-containing protein [Phycisphaeraceae bacterium]